MRRLVFGLLLACATAQAPVEYVPLDPDAARHITAFEWAAVHDAVAVCEPRFDCQIRLEHCRDWLGQQERLLGQWTPERERWFRYLVGRMADQIEYLDARSPALPFLRRWSR